MIYMFLWYVSNTITYRQLAKKFNVAHRTAWRVIQAITSWLNSIANDFNKWPRGPALEHNRRKFASQKKMPDAIGAINGSHIIMKAPKTNKECYFNRKQNYSIVLQGVVDTDKKFINLYCGEPGSLHDSRVLRRSELFKQAERNMNMIFPDGTFFLGDSAYSANSWLVPPFKDNSHLTGAQKNFNRMHSSAIVIVENAFGLMKGRFRRISKFTKHRNIDTIKNITVSVCVLYVCLMQNDFLNEEDIATDNDITSHEEGDSIEEYTF